MTNYERIKNMSVEEMAEHSTRQMLKNIREDCWLSMIDWSCYRTKEEVIKHNIDWLLSKE